LTTTKIVNFNDKNIEDPSGQLLHSGVGDVFSTSTGFGWPVSHGIFLPLISSRNETSRIC